jgi:hypothetical protein
MPWLKTTTLVEGGHRPRISPLVPLRLSPFSLKTNELLAFVLTRLWHGSCFPP